MKNRYLSIIVMVFICIFGTTSMISANSIFIFGVGTITDKLDPGDTPGSGGREVDQIFEGLLELEPGTTNLRPCLATSYNISEDGKEITFHLRKGVKFHDGTDFNADAVIFSFARQYDPNHLHYKYGEWSHFRTNLNDIEKVEKIDDYTVKVILKKVNSAILGFFAQYVTHIVSPSNAEKYQGDSFKHPCGTGPFKLVEWVKQDHIIFEANENYWRDRTKLDKLIFKVIPDASARLMALETGEVHGIDQPNPQDLGRIESNEELILLSRPGANIAYMAINSGYGYIDKNLNAIRDPNEALTKTPGYLEPLTNLKVRQAIQMAIDKQAIVDSVYNGKAAVAKTGVPPSLMGYNNEIMDYTYNPEKAKELLKDAGYPNGFNATLYVMSTSRSYIPDPARLSEVVQGYLRAIGINVEIYQLDWATYLQETEAGKHHLCFLGWTPLTGDPASIVNAIYAPDSSIIGVSNNVAFYNNDEVQKLINNATLTYNSTERIEYYKRVQEIIHEDAYWVYLVNFNRNEAFRKNIKGFVQSPTNRCFFYPVWIED